MPTVSITEAQAASQLRFREQNRQANDREIGEHSHSVMSLFLCLLRTKIGGGMKSTRSKSGGRALGLPRLRSLGKTPLLTLPLRSRIGSGVRSVAILSTQNTQSMT